MRAMFFYTLSRFRGQILGWGIALLLMGFVVVPLYDSIAEQMAEVATILESLPPAMIALIGDPKQDMSDPANYLGSKYFLNLPLLLGIFMVLAASGLVVADEENGTLDLMQAHPISRTSLFLGRLAALVIALLGILALAWLGVVLPMGWSTLSASPLALALPFVSLLGVLLCIGALALLLSLLLPSRRMAATAAGLYLVASFVLPPLATLDSNLEPLARFSPLRYYQSGQAMHGLDGGWLAGLLLVSTLLTIGAWWCFERRDIRVLGEGGWRWPSLHRKAV